MSQKLKGFSTYTLVKDMDEVGPLNRSKSSSIIQSHNSMIAQGTMRKYRDRKKSKGKRLSRSLDKISIKNLQISYDKMNDLLQELNAK